MTEAATQCGILPPNYRGDMDGATACPLPRGHDEPHRTTTPRWGPIEWADDDECSCCIDDDERCIWFGPVPPHERPGMTTAEILRARIENRPGVIGATIITWSGRYFDFIDPQPDQIDAVDLAWGQANTCRFNGQCLTYYSVAQHARLVSEIVPPEHAFAALLHDAAEAYVGDMVGPLKQLIPEFKAIEKRVEAAIFAKFGVLLPLDPCIKQADLRLLRTEQRDLTAGSADSWNGLDAYLPLPDRIIAEAPAVAAERWLAQFHELGGRS